MSGVGGGGSFPPCRKLGKGLIESNGLHRRGFHGVFGVRGGERGSLRGVMQDLKLRVFGVFCVSGVPSPPPPAESEPR